MKNAVLRLVCFFPIALYGMEVHNTVSFLIGSTPVLLTKGCIYTVDGKVDTIIVGTNEQRRLQVPYFDFGHDSSWHGLIHDADNNTVFIRNKDDDSNSDDDTYKPYDSTIDLWKKAYTKRLQTKAMQILEPKMVLKDSSTKDYYYNYFESKIIDGAYSSTHTKYQGYEALQEATKELVACYKTIMDIGKIGPKSIAISSLGTQVGFPRKEAASIALATIITYLQTYKNDNKPTYRFIHLFVKKSFEFEWYKKELMDHCMCQFYNKIFLLSSISKEHERFLLQLPREIIQYILLYMFRLTHEK